VRTLAYLHYDVFTSEALLGNQLAVFTDARGLDTESMQKLTREMNFAESTFILPAEQTGTDIRMRIFAPYVEMPIAGHPTIGSTFALAEMGVIAPGTPRFIFGLNVGPVPVDLEWADGRLRFAWMTQMRPEFGLVVEDRGAVAAALEVAPQDLAPDLPVQQVSCGEPFLFVPLRDPDAVDRAMPNVSACRKLAAANGRPLPLFVFAPVSDARDDELFVVHSRMFAPDFGITEDPATGIASGPLGSYLVRHGVVPAGAPARIESRQGVVMGRASRIAIAITGGRDSITEVKVGGEAVLVGKGELFFG
jgi:trans-2,3-dihydro-3-hydroxyanthranilate isomerase